jgi:hypothetical protein
MESSKDLATNAGKDLTGKDFTNSGKVFTNSVKDLPTTSTNLAPQESFFDLKIVFDNINYIYIFLVLIVLILIGYYLYNKYMVKDDSKKVENDKKKEKEVVVEEEELKNILNSKEKPKNVLNPKEEYYVIDKKGNSILINSYIPDIINNNLIKVEEMKNLQNLNNKLQQELAQIHNDKLKSVQRPKLNHPGETQHIPENILLTEAEDENIATQDLTNDEIAELKSQLQSLQRSQHYQVSALNDEDSD